MTTQELLQKARGAKTAMALASTETKNKALSAMADALERHQAEILAANQLDLDAARGAISSVMLDPTGSQRAQAIRDITDVIVVTGGGEEISLGLGGYLDIGLLDTMEDLLVNFIGAAVFSFVGYFYVKNRGKGWFARNFIPQVLPDGESDGETDRPEE